MLRCGSEVRMNQRPNHLDIEPELGDPEQSGGAAAAAETPGAAPQAVLVNAANQEVIALRQPKLTLGRAPGCDVVMVSGMVARRHATLDAEAGAHWLRCLASTNGVYVNGEKIGAHRLCDGDQIQIGDVDLRYQVLKPR